MAATLKTSTGFGGTPTDGNRVALIGTSSYIQTSDATGTPVTSPATVTTGTSLTVPERATKVTFSTTAALRISELVDASTYFVLPANGVVTIDVTRLALLRLQQDSGSCTVSFYFSLV